MIVGGGNSAGYAARTFVEHGLADGRLCIVTKEVIILSRYFSFFSKQECDLFLHYVFEFELNFTKAGICTLRASRFDESLLVPAGKETRTPSCENIICCFSITELCKTNCSIFNYDGFLSY